MVLKIIDQLNPALVIVSYIINIYISYTIPCHSIPCKTINKCNIT